MDNIGDGGFKTGDVVSLKSGGPKMTVNWVADRFNSGNWEVSCQWFFGDDKKSELKHGNFPPNSLIKIEGHN